MMKMVSLFRSQLEPSIWINNLTDTTFYYNYRQLGLAWISQHVMRAKFMEELMKTLTLLLGLLFLIGTTYVQASEDTLDSDFTVTTVEVEKVDFWEI